ncbi:hypothetical protein GCM10010218_64150 [Streptomyces mashuensis]|uniref:Uncharacterized protein n=1 Tax=Streptomyces mashuensis TaxID=33904 RepID=A0A919B920_9ACTN|nr:hypothetical protein GCM10010218_64150 [Streptomyces mashuensis]
MLAVLMAVTLGVAILSVQVSYRILEPRFGVWAVPTVGALDALWVVFQATEILAGNNDARARRVRYAGLGLTAVNAALPTADLVVSGVGEVGGFVLAVILTPIAIVATKAAWWIVLPSLGRRTSAGTRQRIDAKRQEIADRLEEMEAEAAHRIELLELATALEKRVAEAETAYRKSVLKSQQTMTEELHSQAEATAQTIAEKVLPAAVAAIRLPELGQWTHAAPPLPSPATVGRHATGTQVNALPEETGTPTGTPGVPSTGTPARPAAQAVTLDDLAAVAGVPVPRPGEQLTARQLDVVLRHLRYSTDPPTSYRQARDHFRDAGFVGSEERIRLAWAVLMANEKGGGHQREDDEETRDADAA